MNKSNRLGSFILGILLLVLGVLLLMSRAGVVELNFDRMIAFLILVVGGFEAITAFASSNRVRLFWGSSLFLTGMLVALIAYNFIPDAWNKIWPSALLIPGLAFLMLYFSSPKEYALIIIAVLFIAISLAGLLLVKGNLNFAEDIFGTFRFLVPAAIVFAGFYVIWKKFFKTRA
ncbi:MAG: hypothetical protein WAO19_05630 [Candidatus Kryptoniota bacterium]